MTPDLSILVVDDEEGTVEGLASQLGRIASAAGLSVVVEGALSAADAIAVFKKSRIDAIFLDYDLKGGMTGDDLISFLGDRARQAVIIMMSAIGEEELRPVVVARHQALGVRFRFLTKPISALTLESCFYTIVHLVRGQAGSEALFSWIHLSDLHFGHGDPSHGWDQVLVMRVLLSDIKAQMRYLARPDAIFVTGDIGFSGDTRPRADGQPSREYGDATEFFMSLSRTTGLGPERIFLVPGNHDVQRPVDRSEPNVRRLVEALRRGDEPLDTALSRREDRILLGRRQANYLAFAAQFAPACLGIVSPAEERLWWSHRQEGRGGLNVRLIGLNTALVSADDEDRGKLRLGKACLAQALAEPMAPEELSIVLTHHPLRGGWLADERPSDAWLRTYAHLHLSGHVHEADSEEARSGSGGHVVRVTAGAAHREQRPPGAPAEHGYNIAAVVRVSDGGLRLRVWPRRWFEKVQAFRADSENVPDSQLFAEHAIRPLGGASIGDLVPGFGVTMI